MAELGVGYLTLTRNDDTPWADSATGDHAHGGLTRFGEEVVREVNRSGWLVNLSHTSDDTMRQAIEVSEAPVIFSHSSARALCDVPRNVPDDVLELVGRTGDVVMVTFVPSFHPTRPRSPRSRPNGTEAATSLCPPNGGYANRPPRPLTHDAVNPYDEFRLTTPASPLGDDPGFFFARDSK